MFFAKKIEVAFAEHLRRIERAKEHERLAARPDEPALDVLEINFVGKVLGQRAQKIALAGELLFDRLAIGDIPKCAGDADRPAARIAKDAAPRPQMTDGAIARRDNAVLGVEFFAGRERAGDIRLDPLAIVGMHELFRVAPAAGKFPRLETV